jgi:hypothetical protein
MDVSVHCRCFRRSGDLETVLELNNVRVYLVHMVDYSLHQESSPILSPQVWDLLLDTPAKSLASLSVLGTVNRAESGGCVINIIIKIAFCNYEVLWRN